MSNEQHESGGERVAVVTGGGSGIGLATVLRLVKGGYRVIAADMNLAVCEQAMAATDGRAVASRVDVRSEEDVARVIHEAVTRFGRLDTLVNNAGVGGAFGSVTEVEASDWDFTFEVLVRGVFFGMKHAARVMTSGATMVNIASIAAFNASYGPMAYSAAKAAVKSMTESAAVELAPRMIRVNAVCPGLVRTPLLEAGHGERFDAMGLPPVQPLPRWGHPDDIAAVIEFLAGPSSSFVTGAELRVDGGMVGAGGDHPAVDAGTALTEQLGTDARSRGLVGVNRGSTGEKSIVRKRPPRS
jgi:NAD(P)-dependent dehydrogenase (short-subunit alcohol dehydrogenase family)